MQDHRLSWRARLQPADCDVQKNWALHYFIEAIEIKLEDYAAPASSTQKPPSHLIGHIAGICSGDKVTRPMTKIVSADVVKTIRRLIDQDTEAIVRTRQIARRLRKELPLHDVTDEEVDGLVMKECAKAQRPVVLGEDPM
jgi:hypothetical protein